MAHLTSPDPARSAASEVGRRLRARPGPGRPGADGRPRLRRSRRGRRVPDDRDAAADDHRADDPGPGLVAGALRLAAPASQEAGRHAAHPPRRRGRAGRPGPRPGPPVHGRRQAAAHGPPGGARHLREAGDHLPGDVARRVELVRDRGDPGQARHLRLPDARQVQLPAGVVVGRGRGRAPIAEAGAVPHPDRASPQVRMLRKSRPFWNDPGRARDPELRPARPDHVPTRAVRRHHAVGDVRARSRGLAGDVHVLRVRRHERRAQDRRPDHPRSGPRRARRGRAGRARQPHPSRRGPPEGAVLGRVAGRRARAPAHRTRARGAARRSGFGLGAGRVRDGPRVQAARHLSLSLARGGARVSPLHQPGEHRSRATHPAHLAPVHLLGVPGQALRAVRDAGPGGGHVGPERGRARRGRVPGPGVGQPRRARGDVLRDAAPDPARPGGVRVRRDGSHPAHVHALPG